MAYNKTTRRPQLRLFGSVKFWNQRNPPLCGSPPPPFSTFIEILVLMIRPWNKLFKMAGNSASYPVSSRYTELLWISGEMHVSSSWDIIIELNVSKHISIFVYGTAQMRLCTCVCVLSFPHVCANMCPVMSNGTLTSLTYCTRMLHKGLHTRVCCLSGYICRYIHVYYSHVTYVRVVHRALEG